MVLNLKFKQNILNFCYDKRTKFIFIFELDILAINWTFPDIHEVTIPEGKKMGTTKNSNPKKARSRLCNKEMLHRFLKLVSVASSRGFSLHGINFNSTYLEIKRNQKYNEDLSKATQIFFVYFKDWTRTPDNYLNFKPDEDFMK